jgi:dienelactone hydrolase
LHGRAHLVCGGLRDTGLRRRGRLLPDRDVRALSRLGIEHEFHRYPGAGHGFQRPTREVPAIKAAQADSWQKIFAFLAEKLAAPASAK